MISATNTNFKKVGAFSRKPKYTTRFTMSTNIPNSAKNFEYAFIFADI